MVGIVCPLDAKPAKKLQRNKFFLKNACAIEKSCTFAARNKSGNPKKKDYRLLKTSGNSSVGRARPCQGRGREFESRFPLNAKRSFRSSESRSKLSLIMPSRERKRRLLKAGGNSSVGRARPCQGRGREFESRFPLQKVPMEVGIFCVSA